MYRPLRLAAMCLPLLTACEDGPSSSESTTRLEGTVIATGDYLDQPGQLAVVGDRLVVLDRSAPKVHVFQLPGGQRVRSFGQNGEGPGEFRSARHVQPDARHPGDAWIFDLSLRRMTRLRLVGTAEPVVQEVVNLDDGGGVFLHPVWLTDTTFVASGIYPMHADGRLMLAGRTGGFIRMIGQPPQHPGAAAIPTTVLQHAYEGPVTVSPDRSRFAIATRQADRVEFFRSDGTPVAQVVGSTGFLPQFETSQRADGVAMATGDDLRAGYVDLASTDKHVFALFSGKRRDEAGSRTFFGGQVYVFDWAGRIVARLGLDEPALTIALSPDERLLYAIRHEPEPSVVRYALPRLPDGG
jgi:hypothetical protein